MQPTIEFLFILPWAVLCWGLKSLFFLRENQRWPISHSFYHEQCYVGVSNRCFSRAKFNGDECSIRFTMSSATLEPQTIAILVRNAHGSFSVRRGTVFHSCSFSFKYKYRGNKKTLMVAHGTPLQNLQPPTVMYTRDYKGIGGLIGAIGRCCLVAAATQSRSPRCCQLCCDISSRSSRMRADVPLGFPLLAGFALTSSEGD